MKKHLFLVMVVMLSMFIALNAYGYTPGNGITGTPHDLSKKNNSTYGGATEQSGLDRICVYCHAPHHTIKPSDAATLGYNYVPLWNHDLTTQTFTMYANGTDVPGDPTRQAPNTNGANNPNTTVATTSMNSPTLLCLSCHDGTVATDAYGNAGGPSSAGDGTYNWSPSHSSGTQFIQNGAYKIGSGGDLTNHHPVGFNYFEAYTNSCLNGGSDCALANAVTTTLGATGRTIGQLLWKATWSSSKQQVSGNMECTTCHSVHNKGNGGQRLLWIEDTNSQFCLTCHVK
jgi:predicted CXXCH cytochrome family protein